MSDPDAIDQDHGVAEVQDIKSDPIVVAFERRFFRYLYVTVGLSIIAAVIVTRSFWMTLAVAIGAALGIFNYRWLRSSLLAILGSGSAKPPQGTAFKLIWRYVVIAGIVFAAVSTGRLNLAAIIIGLIVAMMGPPIAEAGYQLYLTLTGRGDF